MTIQEILTTHEFAVADDYETTICTCGLWEYAVCMGQVEAHQLHVAEVLDKHMQEREAKAKATGYTEAADALHSEARWQYERHTRHIPGAQIVAQRMSLMEEIMRDRAKELTNGR